MVDGRIGLSAAPTLGYSMELDDQFRPAGTTVVSRRGMKATGRSDLQAIRLGPSLTVPNSDGRLVLGAWQQSSISNATFVGASTPPW